MDDQEEPDDPASVAANEVVPAPEPDTTATEGEESTRDSSLEMFEQPAPSPPPPLPPLQVTKMYNITQTDAGLTLQKAVS